MTELQVLICGDIEGVSGFVDWQQEDEEPERVYQAMTEDINAAIRGVLSECDADIVVNDSHGGKRNIIIEELHSEATLIRGGPRPHGMISGAEDGMDIGFQIGAHTRPGFGGVLEHVFSSSTMSEVRLNEQPVGEVELNAMGMEYFDVPTGLVTGDDHLKEELSEILPHTKYVVTKEGRGMQSAACRHPEAVRKDIEARAATAVSELDDGYSLGLELDDEVQATVRYHQAETAEKAALWPEIERVDSRTVGYHSTDNLDIYSFLRAASKV